jgi:hypothetical protein
MTSKSVRLREECVGHKSIFHFSVKVLFQTVFVRINTWPITLEMRAETRVDRYVKFLVLFLYFNHNLNVLENLVKLSNIKFHENSFNGSPVVACEQTDSETWDFFLAFAAIHRDYALHYSNEDCMPSPALYMFLTLCEGKYRRYWKDVSGFANTQ